MYTTLEHRYYIYSNTTSPHTHEQEVEHTLIEHDILETRDNSFWLFDKAHWLYFAYMIMVYIYTL